jgi:branched-chain amino acid transport system permease protein
LPDAGDGVIALGGPTDELPRDILGKAVRRQRPAWGEHLSYDLLLNAVTAGILLGGFYAAVTVGISIAFGILDIVNIAHPAFIILGAYVAYLANTQFGIDPIAASLIALPAFYVLGALIYQVYHLSFEKRGEEGQDSLRGLAFFFGILFIT